MKRKSLGQGLGNLLEQVEKMCDDELESVLSDNIEAVREIKIDDITANPYQPRKNFNEDSIKELALSIQNHGLLQPIIIVDADELCKKAKENGEELVKNSQYFLVAGERRLRAYKLLGRDKISAIIANIDIDKTRELTLLENIQREDLNPIELALAYDELIRVRGYTQEELAKSIQKSRTSITNTLRLLSLDKATQQMIIDGKISAGHAKVIAGNKENEKAIVNKIIKDNLNVRDCEEYVKKIKSNKDVKIPLAKELTDKLDSLGIEYKIKSNKITFNLLDGKTIDFLEKYITSL